MELPAPQLKRLLFSKWNISNRTRFYGQGAGLLPANRRPIKHITGANYARRAVSRPDEANPDSRAGREADGAPHCQARAWFQASGIQTAKLVPPRGGAGTSA